MRGLKRIQDILVPIVSEKLRTKNPKVRIEILMTGTKIAACHQIMADCDDLALVQNWY